MTEPGEGDGVDTIHAEGQPAATLDADAQNPTAPTPGSDLSKAGGGHATGGRKARKRRKSKARRVKPAEPAERAAAAAAALAERTPETPEDPNGASQSTDGGDGDAASPGPEEAPGDAIDLEAVAETARGAVPVLRLAIKGAALALRARFPAASAGLFARADAHAARLDGSSLARAMALRFGGALTVAAFVAEFVEPEIDRRWELAQKGAA